MPRRVQVTWLHKGGRKPANVVCVARPSKWGNPFKIGAEGVPDAATAVRLYQEWLMPYTHHGPAIHGSKMEDYLVSEGSLNMLEELRGKDLACYCKPDSQCHADVLLKLANMEGMN